MRLSKKDQDLIKNVILDLDAKARVYLYGSRTIDTLKGGDIDILVSSELLDLKEKITILVKLKTLLGDQKIDLTIAKSDPISNDLFLSQILKSAIEL